MLTDLKKISNKNLHCLIDKQKVHKFIVKLHSSADNQLFNFSDIATKFCYLSLLTSK